MSVFEDLDREPGQPRLSDLWEWARDDYKAGESADVVCERHRLSRSRFYERARDEGWLRRDQPRRSGAPVPDPAEEDAAVEALLLEPPPSAFEMHRLAWARMQRAIQMNRRVEAQGWARLCATLRKLAVDETQGATTWSGVVQRSRPDSPDSLRPPPQAGEGDNPQDGGGGYADGSEGQRRVTPSVPSDLRPAAPPPPPAGEVLDEADSPDSRISPELHARLNRPGGPLHPVVQAAWGEVTRIYEASAHGLPTPPDTSRALSTA